MRNHYVVSDLHGMGDLFDEMMEFLEFEEDKAQ